MRLPISPQKQRACFLYASLTPACLCSLPRRIRDELAALREKGNDIEVRIDRVSRLLTSHIGVSVFVKAVSPHAWRPHTRP